MKRNKNSGQEPQYITKAGLKGKRGWTDSLIKRFMPEPDKYGTNRFYGTDTYLYLLKRVDEIEQKPEFKVMFDSARLRKQSAGRAVKTKRNQILKYVQTIAIALPELTKEELIKKACDSYNRFRAGKQLEYGFDEGYTPATEDSDWHFLNRICINYLRHNCTRYERELENIFGKVGTEEAYKILKERVNKTILEKFTFLEPIPEYNAMVF